MRLGAKARLIEVLGTSAGQLPFEIWLNSFKDKITRAKIVTRLERLKLGILGDYKDLKDGIFEIRVDLGPGYRVYFAVEKDETIWLLGGGDKRSQNRDIKKAKNLWHNYLERKFS